MFKVRARTLLELGSELISSDLIAFYELIKNAFDAGSKIGVEIHFEIILRRNDYLEIKNKLRSKNCKLDIVKNDISNLLNSTAPQKSHRRFHKIIYKAKSLNLLEKYLDEFYASENRIIISDEGSGMSMQDLNDNYLVIGTTSRKKAIDDALNKSNNFDRPPFLGEKGIGRLSAMRLGETLRVRTARTSDRFYNALNIDWSDFDDIDLMLDEITLSPQKEFKKENENWSGTKLYIGRLSSDWTKEQVVDLAEYSLSRLADPFDKKLSRPRIAVYWNGSRIKIPRMDHNLLEHSNASVIGTYNASDASSDEKSDSPSCEFTIKIRNLGFDHPEEIYKRTLSKYDLDGAIVDKNTSLPVSSLKSLGSFTFEIYWFNRRLLTKIDSIGDIDTVRRLQHRWSGILVFRDGFRVLPYGNDDDDWLLLDRKAFGSSGYLLNKNQFIGRINISRFGNPNLIDQTNREGFCTCPEQKVFISLIQLIIQTELRSYLLDTHKRYEGQPTEKIITKVELSSLEKRIKAAIKRIKTIAPNEVELVQDIYDTFYHVKDLLDSAQRRIKEAESENRLMVQMAGIGLLVEVVAHELARSTENALNSLEGLKRRNIPADIQGHLEALQSDMKSLEKRVRVLDPLSISGRQRSTIFSLTNLLDDVLYGHNAQFNRHGINYEIVCSEKSITVNAVKGMIVQIIENLISNSIYWLDSRKKREPNFNPFIKITLKKQPPSIIYEDNGPGIAIDNREKVFRAFYSLKEKNKRRGLGLFIARECAEHHDGALTLSDKVNPETGRLYKFVLELPDERLVS